MRLPPAPMSWLPALQCSETAKDPPIMPATSLASAADLRLIEPLPAPPPEFAGVPRRSRFALLPDAMRVAFDRAAAPLLAWLRTGWLYRQSLRGPVADRIWFYPD